MVQNYTQLYGNQADYANQLHALELARDAKPESPALHFLLGFHYGFGDRKQDAIRELDKAVQLEPRNKGRDSPPRPVQRQAARASGPAAGRPGAPQPQFPGQPQQQPAPQLPMTERPTLNRPVLPVGTGA